MILKEKVPRPEHPRPDFKREQWMNLNGTWGFEMDFSKSGMDRKQYESKSLSGEITVPFCPESPLSGIGYTDFIPAVWYQREFVLPKAWVEKRVILHVGAADYETQVWVNGHKVGKHKGGYSSFSWDITDYVQEGDNDLMVYVEDDTRSQSQPSGKQSAYYESFSCFYTRTTGIWQTVWLECVPLTYIKGMKVYPNVHDVCVGIKGTICGMSKDMEIRVKASYEGKEVGEAVKRLSGSTFTLDVPLSEKHVWEPGHGRLYDMTIQIVNHGEVVDEVFSYFGLRQIGVIKNQIHLNHQSVFQRLVLDQGFYADGIYTAPTEDHLKQDIQIAMDMGFNGARLHEKIFEPLFLYWADRMGYMVWGEYPNWGLDISSGEGLKHSLGEWMEALERDFNHPSIIGWCFYNETENNQDDDVVALMYKMTKQYDTTRPVIDTSGWHHVMTDIYDVHDYTQDVELFETFLEPLNHDGIPEENREKQQYKPGMPFFMSEYGGIKWAVGEDNGWGYGDAPKTKDAFIERYKGLTEALLFNKGVCAFCYTQLYDVEQEVNGLYTYADRQPKFDPEIIKEINQQKAAIEA